MKIEELRKLDAKINSISRENSEKDKKQRSIEANTIFKEAAERAHKKRKQKTSFDFFSYYSKYRWALRVAGFFIVGGVLFYFFSPFYSEEKAYVPGKRTINVKKGKERNAADFVKNLILYSNKHINFNNFIDPQFPAQKKENLQVLFNQLRTKRFELSCASDGEDESGNMDFYAQYQTDNMQGLVALRLDENQRFKIINIEKWR